LTLNVKGSGNIPITEKSLLTTMNIDKDIEKIIDEIQWLRARLTILEAKRELHSAIVTYKQMQDTDNDKTIK